MDTHQTNNDISVNVQRFYNKVPFPGYDLSKYNTHLDLYKNANSFAKKLDYQIPYNAKIVDIGCGTGQLACLLSLKDRNVLGLDFSEASLQKARLLAEKLNLTNCSFERADVLELSEPENKFDYMFCCGVLHHTSDPYKGFKNIIKYGKSGSYVSIGLYNRYGRLFLTLKQFLHNKIHKLSLLGRQRATTDLHGGGGSDEEKDYSWFMDQYEHPYESTHTVGEVLQWFRENGLDYVNSVPLVSAFKNNNNFSDIFAFPDNKMHPPSLWKQYLTQLKWIVSLYKTGGYFMIIGRIR